MFALAYVSRSMSEIACFPSCRVVAHDVTRERVLRSTWQGALWSSGMALFSKNLLKGVFFMAAATWASAVAWLVFALVSTSGAHPQAPVSVPTQTTGSPRDTDLNALRGRAAAGDAQAQFVLGNRYFKGDGVDQDYGQAVLWYTQSANQGYAAALNQLGYMHQNKAGLPLDDRLALKYYRAAAKKGYAQAEYNMGVMYQHGVGVMAKVDDKQAFQWYLKAANQNFAEAETDVGYFYQRGWGVKLDYAQALTWYQRAASQGSSNAEVNLGFMAEKGWGQPQSYAVAFSWYNKAAAADNAEAMENLGYNYLYGVGVAVDDAKAWYWIYQAALLGSSNAENQLGWMYQHGQGVEQSDAKAVAWYDLSAEQGNVVGRNNLSNLCWDLKLSGNTLCRANNTPVTDPALEVVQRRAQIRYLRAQITGLETDALQDEMEANHLANMGKNAKPKKNNSISRDVTKGITKTMDGFGTVLGTPARVQAPQLREEVARLRQELAQLQSLDQSSTNIPAP